MTGATERERCPVCERPRATERDYFTIPEGKGTGLCWRVWDKRQCEEAAPTLAEIRAERDRLRRQRDDLIAAGRAHLGFGNADVDLPDLLSCIEQIEREERERGEA